MKSLKMRSIADCGAQHDNRRDDERSCTMPNSSRLIDEYGFTPFNGWTISGLYTLHRLIHQSLEIYYDQYRNKKTGKINKTLAARETNLKYETFTAYYRAWEHAQHYTVEEIERIFQDEPDRKLLIDITHGLVVLIGRQGLILDDAQNPMNAADMLSLLSGGKIVDSQGSEIPGARYVIQGDYIKEDPTLTIRPYHPRKIGFAVAISLMRRAIA